MMIAKSARPGQNLGVFLLLFVVVTVLAIVCQSWWAIVQDRRLTLESEKANGLVAVRLLEENATQTLQDAERKVDAVVAAIQAGASGSLTDEVVVRNIIAQRLQDARFLKSLQFINLKGESWVSSLDFPAHMADISGREYIHFLLRHPAHRVSVIGHPFQSRYDSQLVIPIARNLFAGDGRHIGVISTDIRVSYFGDVYARAAMHNDACVSLFADEGFVIVRSPFEARYVDRDISASPILKSLKDGPPEGTFEDASFLDDEKARLYIYRKIKNFPITTVYGRDFDGILAPWRQRSEDRVLFAGATIVFIGLLSGFLLLHMRRLHAVEQLQRVSESKFVGIFEDSPVPLALLNLRTDRFAEVNAVLLAQFGYRRDAFIGKTPAQLQLWDNPADRQPYLALLRKQRHVSRYEARFRKANGEVINCLVSSSVFDGLDDEMIIFSALDVTRQLQIEHEIRELNARLEQRVAVRTLKLEAANNELNQALESLRNMQDELIRSEKMAALGSLVAGVAHELNTPIGTSVTMTSVLQKDALKMLTEMHSGKVRYADLEKFLEDTGMGTGVLMRNLSRAAELVKSFKQVAVDQASNKSRRFELSSMLQEIVMTVTPLFKNTAFTLQLDLAPGIELSSFPGPLGQVITNFVTNSLAHGFEGRDHGTMTLATRLLSEDIVEIRFSDDGIGIPAKNLQRVFDPFFTTKLGQGGSGLGMHIVYNLVSGLLGGKVELESTEGKGTTLIITLPRNIAKSAAA